MRIYFSLSGVSSWRFSTGSRLPVFFGADRHQSGRQVSPSCSSYGVTDKFIRGHLHHVRCLCLHHRLYFLSVRPADIRRQQILWTEPPRTLWGTRRRVWLWSELSWTKRTESRSWSEIWKPCESPQSVWAPLVNTQIRFLTLTAVEEVLRE